MTQAAMMAQATATAMALVTVTATAPPKTALPCYPRMRQITAIQPTAIT